MTVGVLVMDYGSPASASGIDAYYTHIRRGRAPSPEQLADLTMRYEAIGGISPLIERSRAQRHAIATALEAAEPGRFVVAAGHKHAPPFVEDGVQELVHAGVATIVGLVLAPHYSRASVGEYHARADEAATVGYARIDSWHLEPAFVDFLAAAVAEARDHLPDKHKVLFTAHSLPERALEGDPYPDQLRESAAAVAERLGLSPWPDWALAWQSAARTPEPWRGPDIVDVIRELGATGRTDGVLVCAQGFVSDHLEVLYDLDVVAARAAADAGLAFARTRSLNDDPAVMAALARRVIDTANTAAGGPA